MKSPRALDEDALKRLPSDDLRTLQAEYLRAADRITRHMVSNGFTDRREAARSAYRSAAATIITILSDRTTAGV